MKKRIRNVGRGLLLGMLLTVWTAGGVCQGAAAQSTGQGKEAALFYDEGMPGSEETPEGTEAPEPTKEPEATEAPEPTKKPEATEAPEPTREPEATKAPEPTKEPEATEAPEPTKKPEATEAPEPTKKPEATKAPEPTRKPEATEAPEPTKGPGQMKRGDFSLELTAPEGEIKGGASVLYEVTLVNTGDCVLEQIQLESTFSCPKVQQEWESVPGLVLEKAAEGGGRRTAVLEALEPGERRLLRLTAQLSEGQEGSLSHKITARAAVQDEAQESVVREAELVREVEPLKVDFSVEKTADRANALPGDEITYWICIRNTGERTLHSVASTERFLGAEVEARFVEQEGVILNGSRTQALIASLAPGESASLKAVVTVPETAAGQELVNQVTVTAKETGKRTVSAQAGVVIGEAPQTTDTPREKELLGYSGGENPKTGDSAQTEFFLLVSITAFFAAAGAAAWVKGKRKR